MSDSLHFFSACSHILTWIFLCVPEPWPSGAGFSQVARVLSESSSIHSDVLSHLSRDMSGNRLNPMPHWILEPEVFREGPGAEESQSLVQVN